MEEIFYSIFKLKGGRFSFYEGKPYLENVVPVPNLVKDFILEGVQHLDELKIFVEKIINRDSVFMPLSSQTNADLSPIETEVCSIIDGKKTVRQLLMESKYSPFVTLNVLSKLMISKIIMPRDLFEDHEVKDDQSIALTSREEEQLKRIFLRYNRTFGEIHSTMQDFGFSLDQDLEEYFQGSNPGSSKISSERNWLIQGKIDEQLILKQIENSRESNRIALVSTAFEDVLFFLLFKSKDFLPAEISEMLIRTIEEIHEE